MLKGFEELKKHKKHKESNKFKLKKIRPTISISQLFDLQDLLQIV